jgi:hypothetical protein
MKKIQELITTNVVVVVKVGSDITISCGDNTSLPLVGRTIYW